MTTPREFNLLWDDVCGANVGLSNEVWRSGDRSRVLTAGSRSELEWNGAVDGLIKDLERVRREGVAKLKKQSPLLVSEEKDG